MSRAVGPDAIYTVPDELLAEVGLRRGHPPSQSYVCSTPDARVVPITMLERPVYITPGRRGLDVTRLRSVLRGFAERAPLPAVIVYQDWSAPTATILNGVHRYFAALAVGYPLIPCAPVPLSEAEQVYQYPEGQQ